MSIIFKPNTVTTLTREEYFFFMQSKRAVAFEKFKGVNLPVVVFKESVIIEWPLDLSLAYASNLFLYAWAVNLNCWVHIIIAPW